MGNVLGSESQVWIWQAKVVGHESQLEGIELLEEAERRAGIIVYGY